MSTASPRARGFSMPAEWADHQSVFVAAPHLAHEWGDHFEASRAEWVEMVRAIAVEAGERVDVLVADESVERFCREALGGVSRVVLHRIAYGDVWTRDTAPIGLVAADGRHGAVRYRFNGWGGKYDMQGDAEVGDILLERWSGEHFQRPLVLEGGALEVDGEGTMLTTESCLFEPNRNPGMGREALEEELRASFGVERVLWVRGGLANDHTDGHIDTIARFVAPGRVVCMAPSGPDDPNRDALEQIASELAEMEDARGRRLEVLRIPSPGFIPDDEGQPLPASYCNFYIGNRAVVVPTYGAAADAAAIEGLYSLFPGRKVVGRSARSIITGGGAFHCMTQQVPGNPE
ncbi:MAG: agmatine deiminase family protein [Polyangiaceae bacterium]|nr:agmatine deiminase family protein [Polyangiaceae bacterium]